MGTLNGSWPGSSAWHREIYLRRMRMELYFAPMEGITGYVYRNAHHSHYGHVNRYYSPFITPNQTRKLTSRELNDLLPEHNEEITLIPQILTNKAEDFIWAAGKLKLLGYTEVNLNLGCPSGTVVAKKRGAGFLALPMELDLFLYTVSRELEQMGMELSVKTRIGREEAWEFDDLLAVFNRYPLKQLIVHPRLQTDFYKNRPNLECFRMAVERSENPVCYNGDLFSPEDVTQFREMFPQVKAMMLGRGILTNPALPELLALEESLAPGAGETQRKNRLLAFHEDLLEGYGKVISGDKNVLFKMKELWYYLRFAFADHEKCLKKIKKSQKTDDYRRAVEQMFSDCELLDPPVFRGEPGYKDECHYSR